MSPEKFHMLPSSSDERIIPRIAEPEHVRSDKEIEEPPAYWHCREVRVAADKNFARFHDWNPEDVTSEEVARSSAGVIRW